MTNTTAQTAAEAKSLWARLDDPTLDDASRAALRARLIVCHLPIAAYLARRYSGRGEPLTDLTQVAVLALIGAVDRFDASRGVPFASFAAPTIIGGIKRHFRDATWSMRVPRRMQELRLQLATGTEELAHTLSRPPTTAELATQLHVSEEDIAGARLCAHAYRPLSLDRPTMDDDGAGLVDTLGGTDEGIDAVDRHELLRRGLAGLPERERRIIALRFFGDMTQSQIAVDLGVSQMHVSRLLAHALAQLRTGLLDDDVRDGTHDVPGTPTARAPSPRRRAVDTRRPPVRARTVAAGQPR